jgi:ribosomal protein S18 acetylase RimI-like enzyme
VATRSSVGDPDTVSASLTYREITAEDAQDVLDLLLLCDLARIGEHDSTMAEVLADTAAEEVFAVGVDDPGGGMAAYAWVEHPPDQSKVYGDVLVRPGGDRSTAALLLDWVREKAREVGPGLSVHVFADSKDQLKNPLYVAAGGHVIRRFYRMAINLGDGWSAELPDLGDDVEIRGVSSDEADLRAMHAVVDVAFLDHFSGEPESYEQWAKRALSGTTADLSLWWLATVAGEPASGLYGAEFPVAGYVDTLGTLRAYRGRGLGRALLLTAFAEFHRRGFRKVVLGVDAESPTGALGLYESVGMRAEHEGWRYELAPLQNDVAALSQ